MPRFQELTPEKLGKVISSPVVTLNMDFLKFFFFNGIKVNGFCIKSGLLETSSS